MPETLPPLREDDHGVMPYQPVALSLYQIEDALAQLFQVREQAEEDGDTEAVAVIDQEIEQYFARKVRKVDSIANAVRFCEAQATLARAEAQRIAQHAQAWEKRVEHIKASALRAMEAHGVTKVQSATNTLTVCGNGGLQPLEVSDPTAVPDQFRILTVAVRKDHFRVLLEAIPEPLGALLSIQCDGIDSDSIRRELRQMVRCPECEGEAVTRENCRCERCDGKGIVPATVPGAKLLPRGKHLRVK